MTLVHNSTKTKVIYADQTGACRINSEAHLSARWARCTVCMRKQCDKLAERRSINYVHNYVEQKVSKAVTSGEPDAGAVYS